MSKQPVKQVQQDGCFSGVAGATNQHSKNISWHARMASFVVARGGKISIIIWNLHIIYLAGFLIA